MNFFILKGLYIVFDNRISKNIKSKPKTNILKLVSTQFTCSQECRPYVAASLEFACNLARARLHLFADFLVSYGARG